MTESPDKLDELEKARDDVSRLEPPSSLEDRVMREVARGTSRARVLRTIAAVIAGIALVGAGWLLRGSMPEEAASIPSNRYVLLLFPSPDALASNHENEDSLVAEYAVWARDEAKRGRVLEGHKLADTSVTLNTVPEARSGLEGYFVVAASNMDEALEIARSCPHTSYGGRVEVRPIEN